MTLPEKIALSGAVAFFFFGLLSGVWKYAHIHRAPDGRAPVYVDICHRASLLYAFACLLLERMVEVSALDERVELTALASLIGFFVFAVFTYAIHGLLKDTENQLKAPYNLGKSALPGAVVHGGMWALVIGELGGFGVLAYGVALQIW